MQTPQSPILMLPREILDAILVQATRARFHNFPYDSYLQTFDILSKQALFESRILDDFLPCATNSHSISFIKHWPIRRNYGAQSLLHSYLVYRVQSEPDPASHRYVEVRHIAEAICRETEADLHDTISSVCWLGLGIALGRLWMQRKPEGSPDLSLLSAAAFVGSVPLVKRLLENGNDPTQTDGIFPSAIEAATLAGHGHILQLFQESLPDSVEPTRDNSNQTRPFLCHYALSEIYHKGKADIQGVVGAAMNGDTDLLEMALCPPSRTDKDSNAYFGYISQGDAGQPGPRRARDSLEEATSCAKNWEIYSKLTSLLPHAFIIRLHAIHIRRYAEYGNFDIVKKLLESGCHVDGEADLADNYRETPLYLASRFGNEDVVDLLLQYGANVQRARLFIHRPLLGAIKSGNIFIVRKLLLHGARFHYYDVIQALLSEYEDMVRLLLDQYREDCLRTSFGSKLANEISDYGLDSMLDLLHDRGCFQYIDGKIETINPAFTEIEKWVFLQQLQRPVFKVLTFRRAELLLLDVYRNIACSHLGKPNSRYLPRDVTRYIQQPAIFPEVHVARSSILTDGLGVLQSVHFEVFGLTIGEFVGKPITAAPELIELV
ncbi:unnamed protein product [Clonostachys solani]|uniref:Uncharacterized protein n=1 Tax=Clonostachys solani TaxID=160281 RepID=A0A9P0EP93_9HYPO|nr:unnamed protein product [Clonostachys solani]